MKYRSEIDGLRAVAVIPVVLFHAGFEWFSGGFVGVDIFFVISGYLITSIIIKELELNNFSILKFYERRARRIIPALAFVILACIPFAWAILLPSDLKDFSQSVFAAATFSSNFLFWVESGYFDTSSEMKPLLHTWSLAVEEQFYILFPIFMMLFWRFGLKRVLYIIIFVFFISLLLAHWGAYRFQSATFYLLPTRAWELLLGSLAAIIIKEHHNKLRIFPSNLMSIFGLGLIFLSFITFNEDTPFPSFFALVPTFGTFLVIVFCRSGGASYQFLSMKPLVYVGLISYSVYLWHQPIFVFWRHHAGEDPSHLQMLVLSLSVFPVAILSYLFVEQPFRSDALISQRRSVFATSAAVLSVMAVFGIAGHFNEGWNTREGRGGIPYAELELGLAPNPGIDFSCIEQRNIESVLDNARCETSDDAKVLLWGDSYAMHLFGMLYQNPLAQSLGVRQISMSQCMPNASVALNGSITSAQECISFNQQVLNHIENTRYDFVILSSPFNRVGRRHETTSGRSVIIDSEADLSQILREAAAFIEATGARVIFVQPPPTNGVDLGRCVAGALWRGQEPEICDYQTDEISASRLSAYETLSALEDEYLVLDMSDVLCRDEFCMSSISGVPIYRDTGHFSVAGSETVGRVLDPFGLVLTAQ